MKPEIFIDNYRAAFGPLAELPIVFWFSEEKIAETYKAGRCIFSYFGQIREGKTVSLSIENIGCGGGKFYSGLAAMAPHIPEFVSHKERYKESPEMVLEFIAQMAVPRSQKPFVNFTRIDNLKDFNNIEGVLFLATPDILSGLATWAYFDNNSPEAVCTLFGSGCGNIITRAVIENASDGERTYIGLMDPSARQYLESNLLSFLIPMSRFKTMYHTMRRSCLFDTRDWARIRDRIEDEAQGRLATQ